jgi:hypothetical protein
MLNNKSKKVMGRPPIGMANERGVFFAARFTPAEARELNGAIRYSGQSKSAWIRNGLLSAARRGNVSEVNGGA